MSASKSDQTRKSPPNPREVRLAKALRDNLRRRKAPAGAAGDAAETGDKPS